MREEAASKLRKHVLDHELALLECLDRHDVRQRSIQLLLDFPLKAFVLELQRIDMRGLHRSASFSLAVACKTAGRIAGCLPDSKHDRTGAIVMEA